MTLPVEDILGANLVVHGSRFLVLRVSLRASAHALRRESRVGASSPNCRPSMWSVNGGYYFTRRSNRFSVAKVHLPYWEFKKATNRVLHSSGGLKRLKGVEDSLGPEA